jgi:DNA-binding NarL/FixJ family response regulator
MSRFGAEASMSAGSSLVTGDRVALIASNGPRQRIGEILAWNELEFDAFDDVEALRDEESCSGSDPSLVVLWVEDTATGLARCVESLRQCLPATAVIVACTSIERWGVRSALAAGAAGVVLAGDLDATLAPCVQAVQSGQICVPQEYRRQIEPPPLSAREKQALGLVVMGFTNGQIARQLFLAESTVKSHLSSAFGKLGVRSRNEAVNLIVDPERGLGMGILALGGEQLESGTAPAR